VNVVLSDVTQGIVVGSNGFITSVQTSSGGSLAQIPSNPSVYLLDSNIKIISGDGQSSSLNSLLPSALSVLVTDHSGTPIANKNVHFSIVSAPNGASGQQIIGASQSTDASGKASAQFLLGSAVGVYCIKVNLDDTAAFVLFNENAENIITLHSGNYVLTDPVAKDKWKSGTYQYIAWKKVGGAVSGSILLEYSTDNGATWVKINKSPISGLVRYSWLTPNCNSSNCKIRISNYVTHKIYDETKNPFTIYPGASKAVNFPNPFNPTTKISFNLEKGAFVNLKVYNSLGQQVKELVNKQVEAGLQEVEFNASSLSSGVYYYILKYDDHVEVNKMMLLK
jgi:hypothetical protein